MKMAANGFSRIPGKMSFFCKVLAAHPKKQKRVEGSENGGNVDLISELPDSLLHHILSLLPTDLAVSTSILSKRWKDLWMWTTNLKFNSFDRYKRKQRRWPKGRFRRFMKQVLLYHSSNITKFNLGCWYNFESTLVESWLSAAVQRHVQEIHLCFQCPVLSLPVSLCTSKILRVLEVKAFSDLCLPSMILLPSLKILRLEDVKFIDDLSFARLFSGLPCIEELKIDGCDWEDIENADISLPTLRRFTFNNRNVDNEDSVVKITAENLLNFNYESDLDFVDCIIDTMPLLAHAKVSVDMLCEFVPNARAVQYASNLFGAIGFVKSLHIGGDIIKFLDSCCSLENINIFPMFVRLTTLKIECKISRSAAALLMTIFQNAPLLESLVIMDEVRGGKWSKKPHPHCIEFRLKKCSLWTFYGHSGDILFVKFLLKTATKLEELKIHSDYSLWKQQAKWKDIKNKLESVRRASKCCVLNFF